MNCHSHTRFVAPVSRMLVLLACTASAHAQTTAGIVLRDGVVVDPTADTAYVMSPNKRVSAIDLSGGAVLWSSAEAAKPLAIAGNLLVSQVEPRAASQMSLEVAALDVRNRGAVATVGSEALPSGVFASVAESLESSFTAKATARGSDVTVAWEHAKFPRGGEAPPPGMPAAAGRSGPTVTRGAFQLDLSSGATTPGRAPSGAALSAPALRRVATPRVATASTQSSVTKSPPQFESADGRHRLMSQRVGDDRTFEKYRWLITDRATGKRVGEVRSHVSVAPFVVRGGRVLFTTKPYEHGNQAQPSKLRAVDLETGREAWAVQIRELEYDGPIPP